MERGLALCIFTMLLAACAHVDSDAYPEGWPQLVDIGPDCLAVAGTYSVAGKSNDAQRPEANLITSIFRISGNTWTRLDAASLSYQLPPGTPDQIRLSFTDDKKLRAEGLRNDGAIPAVQWIYELKPGEDGYRCGPHGLQIPAGGGIPVMGYNSDLRVLLRAEDRSLILRESTDAVGVFLFPPIPVAWESIAWERFAVVE